MVHEEKFPGNFSNTFKSKNTIVINVRGNFRKERGFNAEEFS